MVRQKLANKISKYRFEIKHISIFLAVLILFQFIMAFVQKSSLDDFLFETQSWYQKYSAERLAIVTSTSMELLFENLKVEKNPANYDERKITYSFNVIFKQQLMQRSVEDICLILLRNHRLYVIESGHQLYQYLTNNLTPYDINSNEHKEGVELFLSLRNQIKASETIYSTLKEQKTFDILVPFVPNGEYMGVMYMKITPDFNFLTKEVTSNFDKITIIYSSLIFLGLIAIFYVSSRAVIERNDTQKKLYEQEQDNFRKQIRLEKESLFTKRIYHTHHKAEKIIGFIKDDVRAIDAGNMDVLKKKVVTYSNFISRIIYDMKWYDQEINTIINPMFQTNINEVIKFLRDNIFLRISSKNEMFNLELDLDEKLPIVNVNEYIVWEILEPIIQNSIDHGNKRSIIIKIKTKFDEAENKSYISISDNGIGIKPELLEDSGNGIKRIFREHESTKKIEGTNSGYGCYIAYQMAVEKCGWEMDVKNLDEAGCEFIFIIKDQRR